MQGYPPPGGYGPPPPDPGFPPPAPGMLSPMAPYGIEPTTGVPYSDKSKVIAGVLQLTLGAFGAGRFYTGHIGIAVAQMCVSLFTCVGWIWPLVDGIMMLTGRVTDAQGRPLRD